MNIKEIIQQFKDVNKQTINEMSMVFRYKDRHVEVCAWVENPTPRDNRYFKYYDSMYIDTATKVARIRINESKYVGGNHKERKLKKWILSNKEKQYLIDILKSESDNPANKGYTRWQEILMRYNEDNFGLYPEDTKKGNFEKAQSSPNLPSNVKPFPIDYPMPNYLELE